MSRGRARGANREELAAIRARAKRAGLNPTDAQVQRTFERNQLAAKQKARTVAPRPAAAATGTPAPAVSSLKGKPQAIPMPGASAIGPATTIKGRKITPRP